MPNRKNSLVDALRESTRPAPKRPQAGRVVRGEGTRLVGAHFPEPVHRQLRMLAAREGRTMFSVLAEALNELFAKRKLPPIA